MNYVLTVCLSLTLLAAIVVLLRERRLRLALQRLVSVCWTAGEKMNRSLNSTIPLMGALMLAAGCSSRDDRLTRMAAQQAALNKEMVKLNRDVAQGMSRLTQENAEFRKEALAVQKQLHEQRAELIRKQEALTVERRRYRSLFEIGETVFCCVDTRWLRELPVEPDHAEPDDVGTDRRRD